MKSPTLAYLGAALVFASALSGQDAPKTSATLVERPAAFEVTTDILNPALEPFTVTGPGFGNTLKRTGRGGFEPFSFRNRFIADRNSPDRVYTTVAGNIHVYESYAHGFLDGAHVYVYRITNGKMQLAHEATIPADGTVIEEWNTDTRQIIKPTETSGVFKWDEWNRSTAERWFTVFAISKTGTLSAPAMPAKMPFLKAPKSAVAKNNTVAFTAPKDAKPGTPPPAPQNLRVTAGDDGFIHFKWDAAPADSDIAGYVIGRTDTDPASHRGVYLQLAWKNPSENAAIKNGDLVIVHKDMAPFKPEYLSHRLGGRDSSLYNLLPYGVPNDLIWDTDSWKLVPHTADTPVEEAGQTYFEMTLKDGVTQKVGLSNIPDISSTSQHWYPTPHRVEYRMDVWVKADRADAPPVVFEYSGDVRIGGFVKPKEFQPTTEWQKFTHVFMGEPSAEGHHAYFVLTCKGPATYSIDNFRVYRADTAFLDYTEAEYARLRESGMMAYRTHGPIKTKHFTYSMDQFTAAPGLAEGVAKGNTLPHALRMISKANIHPWLQIEFHMSPAEWLGFVEYMAAPYDPATDTREKKPWAHKRHQQGRTAPWTDQFERIYFELGNETWNGIFAPWTFLAMPDAATGKAYPAGQVYGMFHDHVVGIMRTSPYWSPDLEKKFIHIIGGFNSAFYGDQAIKGSDTAEFMTLAVYNGGWDEGEGPPRRNPASFFSVLNVVNQTIVPRARRYLGEAIEWKRSMNKDVRLGTYEAGPGYALNGLNNARVTPEQAKEQEFVMKSKAAGVATLDTFLAQAAHDYDLQNFFTFAEGDLWKSHAHWHAGGQPHPSFLYLMLFNKEATGDLLRVATRNVSTVSIPAFQRRQAVTGGPQTAVYATRKGDRVNVFVLSRRFAGYPDAASDGFSAVELKLPFTSARKITLHRATGTPENTNIESETVRLETRPVATSALKSDGRFAIGPDTGGTARGLPPAEALLFVFEGTNIGPDGKQLSREEVLKLPATFTGSN